MKIFRFLFLFILFISQSVKAEECFSVNGAQFEKIGYATLLIMYDGKNWGTLDTIFEVPNGRLEFRFFTPNLCDSSPNDHFQINGELFSVYSYSIKKFK